MRQVGIVVHDGYLPVIHNAYLSTRMGYLHGFQKIGMQASFVQHSALTAFIQAGPVFPLLWLTGDDYNYLDEETLEAIRECPHIIMVNTQFDGMVELHASFSAPSPEISKESLNKIAASKPGFVWSTAPEPYLWSYQGWMERGLRVVSLPWACDSAKYVDPKPSGTRSPQVAFVGGYRAYKEPQYAAYLWPYEDRLKVWGYSRWPRCYQGQMPERHEQGLYSRSVVCPTISEPQFAITGDTVERPFKVMGSGGLTVFDPVLAYGCLFESWEALMPKSEAEHREMMEEALNNPGVNALYRQRGRDAVMARHLYRHRAQKIVEELGLC